MNAYPSQVLPPSIGYFPDIMVDQWRAKAPRRLQERDQAARRCRAPSRAKRSSWRLSGAIAVMSVWGLTGMSCPSQPYGTAEFHNRSVVGADRSRTCETWAKGGLEAQAPFVKAKNGCGDDIDTGAQGVQAFAGQAIAAQLQAQLSQTWAQGFQTGLQTLLPAICAAGTAAASVPWLAALCGIKQPTPPPAQTVGPAIEAREP